MEARILLVDDETRILEVLSDMIREIGFSVATAAAPAEALRLAQEESFDIAIIDNYLGETDGVTLIEQMSRIRPDIHFVIMTGNPNIDLAVSALKNGAADFLRKPFRVEDLLVSIQHMTRRRLLDQERKKMLAGLELKVRETSDELKQLYLSVLVTLSRTVEKKDLGTYGHSKRVSEMSAMIAETLGLSPAGVEDVRAASLLHDIGKIGISDSILGKQGPLDPEELEIVRSHPANGIDILQPLKQFESLLPAILHHHERCDGSGYPHGLLGESIPLGARIIAVADAYDAILSDRPYRLAAHQGIAVQELKTGQGTQFDRAVVEAFLEIIHRGTQSEQGETR